jgi:heptaprenylglyceryl phosphate synthase
VLIKQSLPGVLAIGEVEVISNGVNVALHKSVQNSGANTYILDTSKTPSLSQTHTISTGNYTISTGNHANTILMLLIVYFEPKSIITHPSFKML